MNDLDQLAIRNERGGVVLAVKVVPGASRNRIAGVLGDALKVTVSAPAEKGKANAAVATVLAKALCVNLRDVELSSGQTNARKEFIARGLSVEDVRERMMR